MNYRAFIKGVGKDDASAWSEEYAYHEITTLAQAEEQARGFVNNFNASLRAGEKARVFVRVEEVVDPKQNEAHAWSKTNMYTLLSPSGAYDAMRCDNCFVTGKRYGLSIRVTLDSQYRAKAFRHCASAARET